MSAETIITVVVAVLGSNLIQFFINRIDNRKRIKEELHELKIDHCRTHMLLLISDYPDEISEIMSAADYYFRVLKANSYISIIFAKWLKKNNLPVPIWFTGGEKNDNS